MSAPATREWVARFKYDGFDECYFGTVTAESEMEAETKAFERWAEIFPIAPPRTFTMIPGCMILRLDEA